MVLQRLWSVVLGTAANVHELGLKPPDLSVDQFTLPPGVVFDPHVAVSVTVAVQVVDSPITTGEGLHTTAVVFSRRWSFL